MLNHGTNSAPQPHVTSGPNGGVGGGAARPFNETQRLAALHRYKVLDTGSEQAYDDVTTLASAVCKAPIALVSLVDKDRQWFKSRVGLESSETPRELSFCAHAILQPDSVFEVQDALLDARFANNPLVTGEPGIRFYAGAPLVTADGLPIGTVCVIDREPRTLSPPERKAMQSLARQVVAQLELRQAMAGLALESLTDPLTSLWNRRGLDWQLRAAWDVHVQERAPLSLLMMTWIISSVSTTDMVIRRAIACWCMPPPSSAKKSVTMGLRHALVAKSFARCCRRWMLGLLNIEPSNYGAQSRMHRGLRMSKSLQASVWSLLQQTTKALPV